MLRPDSSFSICRLLVAITAILIIGLVTFQNSIISGIRSLQPSHLSSPAATTEGKVSHKFAGAIDGGWASRPLSPKGGLLWVQYNETFSVTWGITVFHALHCVDMLRAYMLNDTGVHLHETEEPTAAPDMDTGVHLSHCLDYISQVSEHEASPYHRSQANLVSFPIGPTLLRRRNSRAPSTGIR